MNLFRADRELTRRSYYAATAQRVRSFPVLQGDTVCDVAVVGGGLAGLSAALELAERGYAVTLLEAQEIGFGASGRNGGQAIHGLACEQSVIEKQLGREDSHRIWTMTVEALDLLRQRILKHGIDCEWQDGFVGAATSPRKAKALTEWADQLERDHGYALQRIAAPDMARWVASPRLLSGVFDPRSGHLHPLKYTLGLAQAATHAGVKIHEHSAALRLSQGANCTLHTAQGAVLARHVLLAGNVYLDGVANALQARIMPVGTYIACSEPLPPERAQALIPSKAAVCDTNFVLDYFRTTVDHRMLYGGRVSYSTVAPANLDRSMQARMLATFPQLAGTSIEFAWGGFVDITMNRAPDFGRLPAIGAHTPNVYYLQGFSGHGLALTGLAGQLVAQAIDGDSARFDTFAKLRHRRFPGGPALRMPALVLGMAWYRLKDLL